VLPPHLKMIGHGVAAGDRASHLTSLPYCMAVAAWVPNMAFDVGASPASVPSAVRAFMDKITVEADERLLADYPRAWPARVSIEAALGRYERLLSHVPGDPARPFDRSQVREKFLRFITPVLGTARAEQFFTRCGEALAGGQFASLVAEIEQACKETLAPHFGR
jgi:2-methylcitrate dehydratase PrpD